MKRINIDLNEIYIAYQIVRNKNKSKNFELDSRVLIAQIIL